MNTYYNKPMKTIKSLFAAVAVLATLVFSSCSKPNDTPFNVYFLSSQPTFPTEIHVVYNNNFIGDIKKVDTENTAEIARMRSGLNTIEKQIGLKVVDNKGTVLSEMRFSLLPDGTYKKVSSSGSLSYELKTIESHKFAIFFTKLN